MSNSKAESPEARQAGLAPETHNDEQDEHLMQAQAGSAEARRTTVITHMPTESEKDDGGITLLDMSKQDTVDHMRDMESSGRIDMDAYAGEPNHDDNEGKYGKGHAAKDDAIDQPTDPVAR